MMYFVVAIVSLVVGLELGWRWRLKEITERLANKGYDTDKVLGK
tara:strand:- start:1690 stop:1821 length:132 start_codon:yes stop_codon:yes gene_type:complete